MKFKSGDLVAIVSTTGKIIDNSSALIISGGLGFPKDLKERVEPEETYTILYMGDIEYSVASEWLTLISSRYFYPEIS